MPEGTTAQRQRHLPLLLTPLYVAVREFYWINKGLYKYFFLL